MRICGVLWPARPLRTAGDSGVSATETQTAAYSRTEMGPELPDRSFSRTRRTSAGCASRMPGSCRNRQSRGSSSKRDSSPADVTCLSECGLDLAARGAATTAPYGAAAPLASLRAGSGSESRERSHVARPARRVLRASLDARAKKRSDLRGDRCGLGPSRPLRSEIQGKCPSR
jgi:hypothetical protein